jgi:hypothetical protein
LRTEQNKNESEIEEKLQKNKYENEKQYEPLEDISNCQLRVPVHKCVMTHQSYFWTQAIKPHKYLIDTVKLIVQTITTINHQFAQIYNLIKGIKKFGKRAHQTAYKK